MPRSTSLQRVRFTRMWCGMAYLRLPSFRFRRGGDPLSARSPLIRSKRRQRRVVFGVEGWARGSAGPLGRSRGQGRRLLRGLRCRRRGCGPRRPPDAVHLDRYGGLRFANAHSHLGKQNPFKHSLYVTQLTRGVLQLYAPDFLESSGI